MRERRIEPEKETAMIVIPTRMAIPIAANFGGSIMIAAAITPCAAAEEPVSGSFRTRLATVFAEAGERPHRPARSTARSASR